MKMPQVFGLLHTGYMIALGLAGWGLLILATFPLFGKSSGVFRPIVLSWELGACLALMGIARLLTFRVFGRTRIALDSALYVAAYFVFGALATAWMALIAITADGVQRLFSGTSLVARGEAPWRHSLALVFYNGGLPSLVLLMMGALFGALVQGGHGIELTGDLDLSWQVALFTLVFLWAYYAIAGQATWFAGSDPATLVWRGFVLRVIGVEFLLVPVSLAMVLGYKHQGIGLFLLIGASGLLFGGIFKRWSEANDKVRKRVVELSVLNRIARAISTSTETLNLWRNIAQATLSLVGKESFFCMGVLDEPAENIHYRVFNSDAKITTELVLPPHRGISGWVLRERKALNVGDLVKEYANYADDETYKDPTFHSWAGVPLLVADEPVGVISVQSRQRNAYTDDHLRVLNIIADQAAVAIEKSRLYQLATIDGLTGLFVRRYFDHRLVEEWGRSKRYKAGFSIGMVDLDHFKAINDTYGHQAGDKVLRAAGRILRNNMRSFDIAARYGGEEFVFILPRTSVNEAKHVAERIRADTEALTLTHEDKPLRVTASIGVAESDGEGVESVEDLLEAADKALYAAKAQGRNRVLASSQA